MPTSEWSSSSTTIDAVKISYQQNTYSQANHQRNYENILIKSAANHTNYKIENITQKAN